jgi:putative transposase
VRTVKRADHRSHHERWAHLRFAVVGQLLASPPPKGELRAQLKELAAREWPHPITGLPVRFGVSTFEAWYYQARGSRATRCACCGARCAKMRVCRTP